jgi:hypothetical protein
MAFLGFACYRARLGLILPAQSNHPVRWTNGSQEA